MHGQQNIKKINEKIVTVLRQATFTLENNDYSSVCTIFQEVSLYVKGKGKGESKCKAVLLQAWTGQRFPGN